MKRHLILILAFTVIGIINGVAQVTIGSLDNPKATLDVRSSSKDVNEPDGIIAPKLTGDELAGKANSTYTSDQKGALVYVTEAASSANQKGKTVNIKAPGYYYYDSDNEVWVAFAKQKREWFYMPSTPINTEAGANKTIDLYSAYKASVTNSIKSAGADFSEISPVLTATDFDYYVVGYDDTLFSNISISSSGVMTYDCTGDVTDESYINIVFVRK